MENMEQDYINMEQDYYDSIHDSITKDIWEEIYNLEQHKKQ